MRVRDRMTSDPVTLSSSTTLVDAARRMRDEDIGDVLVEDGRAVGMVSIGDLAIDLDSTSALADISAAPANN